MFVIKNKRCFLKDVLAKYFDAFFVSAAMTLQAWIHFFNQSANLIILYIGLFIGLQRAYDAFFSWRHNWIIRKKEEEMHEVTEKDKNEFNCYLLLIFKKIVKIISVIFFIFFMFFYFDFLIK